MSETKVYFHVTPAENVPGILHNGLLPSVETSECSNGEEQNTPVVFLFPSWDDLEDALMGWLGDRYDDDAPLAALEVRISPDMQKNLVFHPEVGFEVKYLGSIPPECIKAIQEF